MILASFSRLSFSRWPCTVFLMIAGSILMSGCSRPEGNPNSKAGASGSPPAVSVTTVRADRRDMPVKLEATGTVSPLSVVDVKPQVTSVVNQVHVKEGQFVKRGELLFTLDSRADQANVAKALAQLSKDEAALSDALRQLARSQQLLAESFVSQGALNTSQTAVETQKAAVDAARIPLLYARISARSAGRIGTISVFPGSAVQANLTPMLSITQLNPIAVAFSVPQRYLTDVMTAMRRKSSLVEITLP